MSNLHIGNAIRQLLDAKGEESSVQIINSVIDECKQKITKVAFRRNGEIRKCDDFAGEYGRGPKKIQRYEFRRKAWGEIPAYMAEQIQCLVSRAHRDVLAKWNLSCEVF